MPKPLLLRRPSGLYARFLLPADTRPLMGTRFIVRSLCGHSADGARLRAAQLGYALTAAIEGVRSKGGKAMDAKKLIEAALAAAAKGETRSYELNIPGIVSLRADGPEDHARAMDALERTGVFANLKNHQSKRFLPLPQRVRDLGIREYVQDIKAAGFTELFPGGSPTAKNGRGDKISKWYNRSYLRHVCAIKDPDVCFQSFRNTFMTAGDRCGVSEVQMNPLVGHGPRSLQQKHYIDGPTLKERSERIERAAAH